MAKKAAALASRRAQQALTKVVKKKDEPRAKPKAAAALRRATSAKEAVPPPPPGPPPETPPKRGRSLEAVKQPEMFDLATPSVSTLRTSPAPAQSPSASFGPEDEAPTANDGDNPNMLDAGEEDNWQAEQDRVLAELESHQEVTDDVPVFTKTIFTEKQRREALSGPASSSRATSATPARLAPEQNAR